MSARLPAADARLERYLTCYEQLSVESVVALASLFGRSGRFVDPFNDVRGATAVAAVFQHLFTNCSRVRFDILASAMQADVAFVEWRCALRLKRWRARETQQLVGASRITFDAAGGVLEHVDYWDAAHQVYERLPLLGAILRRLRRAFAVASG